MANSFRPDVIALALTLATISNPASAQSDAERAGARSAGLAGIDAYNAGKYEQTLDYFGRAESLLHAPTHVLYMARAHAKLGHLVSAREFYLKLTQERLPTTASKPFRDAQAAGDKELNELEPRVPYVSVVVQGAGAKDVQVSRDGERIPQGLLGVPHPEDPGMHSFKATAEGMESAASSITLKEGVRETVLLTLSRSAGAEPAASPGTNTTTGSVGFGANGADSTPSSNGPSGLRIASYITIGVGAVGVGLGTYFLVKSGNTRSEADDLHATCLQMMSCREPATQASITTLDDDANSQRAIGITSVIVGGAALATGVTLLVIDLSSSKKSAAAAKIRPALGLNYLGVSGQF